MVSEPPSAASAKPAAISFLTLEFVSTPIRSRSSATVASSSDRNMSRTASNRTATSGLDNAKCATVVLNMRLKLLFVPILLRLSAGADPASFSDSGSIKLRGSPSAGLTIKTF